MADSKFLLKPERLWTRAEVLAIPCPVPKEPGVYAWYFCEIPPRVPADRCLRSGETTLLYLGISPDKLPMNGKAPSRQCLRDRLPYHFRGNAEGSTLRLTLGCLLSERLGIELRRVGSGRRMTFGPGEELLSQWMSENALVSWISHPRPWELEEELIAELFLPLNLDRNKRHPFYPVLRAIRQAAKDRARELPIGHGIR